jgi:hypothetical protein
MLVLRLFLSRQFSGKWLFFPVELISVAICSSYLRSGSFLKLRLLLDAKDGGFSQSATCCYYYYFSTVFNDKSIILYLVYDRYNTFTNRCNSKTNTVITETHCILIDELSAWRNCLQWLISLYWRKDVFSFFFFFNFGI